MKTKMFILLSFLLIYGTSVFAQPQANLENNNMVRPGMEMQQRGPRPDHQRPFPPIPDLTDEQKEKIDDLAIAHNKTITPIMNQIGEKKARMRSLTTAENVNMNEVYKVIDEMSELEKKMMKENAKHHQEVRKLLTDKQRIAFDSQHPRHRHMEQHPQR